MGDFLAAFKRMDKDGNNTVSWEEFQAAAAAFNTASKVSSAMATGQGKKDLRALFDKCDRTGDGKISILEWGKAVVNSEECLVKYFGGDKDSDFLAAFKLMDKDRNNTLCWAEFEAAAEQGP